MAQSNREILLAVMIEELPAPDEIFPRNAAQLRELGVGYANCAATPEARLLRSLEAQVTEARKLLAQS